jgi:predicted O-methyltransferase YrrM
MTDRPYLVFPETVQRDLTQYLRSTFVDESPEQKQINIDAAQQSLPQISLRPEEGWLLYFLVKLARVKIGVEIGTLAGYSASWIARALPEDGKLICLEVDSTHARIANNNMKRLGFSDKVEIIVGDARDSLNGMDGEYDLVFIDADKTSYPFYLEWALNHLKSGGLLLAHNAFQDGLIIENPDEVEEQWRESTRAMQTFNQRVAQDERLTSIIVPAGDGLLAAIMD